MKSRAIHMLSYEDVMDHSAFTPEGVEAYVEKSLKRLARKNRTFEAVEKVETGDIVTIKVCGKQDKFNQEQVKVSVGNGFYDETIEKALVGMQVSETKNVTCDGEQVEFAVLSAERAVLPEVTDEIVAKETEYGTVGEYCEKMREKNIKDQVESEATRRARKMIDRIIAESEWRIDEEEIQEYIKDVLENEKITLKYEEAWDDIAYTLVCCEHGGLDPEKTKINSREYNAFARLIEQLEETIQVVEGEK